MRALSCVGRPVPLGRRSSQANRLALSLRGRTGTSRARRRPQSRHAERALGRFVRGNPRGPVITETRTHTIAPDITVYEISGRLNLSNTLLTVENTIRGLIDGGAKKI